MPKDGTQPQVERLPDNRCGANYQGNEINANESRNTERRNEREVTYEDDNSCNIMIDEMISDEDKDMPNIEKCYDSDSIDKNR